MKSAADMAICGVDEAGRGPLAGAVFAAAVVLDALKPIHGLTDSKMLSAKRRAMLALEIRERAVDFFVASASVEEIDRLNILQASLLAMARAVRGLRTQPDEMLVDGLYLPAVDVPGRAIVQGDRLIAAISAASILAKTARDTELLVQHEQYPEYGFAQHKGYGTASHLQALRKFGPCPIHRMSFAPVRAAAQDRTLPCAP